MMPGTTPTERDVQSLPQLFRKTIHAANNELMSIVQESELALMSDDLERMRRALEFAIDRVMAISRIHRETRRVIIENTEGADGHGHLHRSDPAHGADEADEIGGIRP
jgi:two-component sensor histidine kinase